MIYDFVIIDNDESDRNDKIELKQLKKGMEFETIFHYNKYIETIYKSYHYNDSKIFE